MAFVLAHLLSLVGFVMALLLARAGEQRRMVQVVGSGSDVESDRIYDALLSGTFDAKRRLWVATP